jgi:hypothetical protein
MNRFQHWWLHFKLTYWGDDKYEKNGGAVIPCKRCGALFRSFDHFDYYDALCEWCEFASKDPRDSKREIQNILIAYEMRERNWEDTKAYLRGAGIKIIRPQKQNWGGCSDSRFRSFQEAKKCR